MKIHVWQRPSGNYTGPLTIMARPRDINYGPRGYAEKLDRLVDQYQTDSWLLQNIGNPSEHYGVGHILDDPYFWHRYIQQMISRLQQLNTPAPANIWFDTEKPRSGSVRVARERMIDKMLYQPLREAYPGCVFGNFGGVSNDAPDVVDSPVYYRDYVDMLVKMGEARDRRVVSWLATMGIFGAGGYYRNPSQWELLTYSIAAIEVAKADELIWWGNDANILTYPGGPFAYWAHLVEVAKILEMRER